MRRGAEINLQNSDGGTALMLAASNGHERVVELLLRHGAEINLQNSDGGTALMLAAGKATSGWSSCCCGTARRSTCRTATAAPR